MGYRDADGNVAGFHPYLVRAALEPLGITEIEFIVSDFGAWIPGLQARRFDMIASGISVTPERCAQEALSALMAGPVDGNVLSGPTALMMLEDPNVGDKLERVTPFTGLLCANGEPVALYTAIAFRPGDTELCDAYNARLADMTARAKELSQLVFDPPAIHGALMLAYFLLLYPANVLVVSWSVWWGGAAAA